MLTRRSFLPLLAAPAVLKLGVYMPVSSAKLVQVPLPANPVFVPPSNVRLVVGYTPTIAAMQRGFMTPMMHIMDQATFTMPVDGRITSFEAYVVEGLTVKPVMLDRGLYKEMKAGETISVLPI